MKMDVSECIGMENAVVEWARAHPRGIIPGFYIERVGGRVYFCDEYPPKLSVQDVADAFL